MNFVPQKANYGLHHRFSGETSDEELALVATPDWTTNDPRWVLNPSDEKYWT
jgi:hypothetical protein